MSKPLPLIVAALACLHASTALGLWTYERPQGNTAPLMGCWSDDTASYAVGLDGTAFRHQDGTWTDIADTALDNANLLAVHGTPSGTVYAAGFRLGPPRFDSNSDGRIDTDDAQSLYGVIFRHNGSDWKELSTGHGPDSPFFASSFTGIWTDEDHAVYFAGGQQQASNTEPPCGVLLSSDGASFTPLIGASNQQPGINGIWGNRTHAYLACSAGRILELDRTDGTFSTMNSAKNNDGYSPNFRGILGDADGTLYAVTEATTGGIFRYDAACGWQPMGIDREQAPPLACIAKQGALLVASGSYGKTYYLDKDQDIWKEMLVGTQSHINFLSVKGDELLGVTSGGELYRMTETDPTTAYILADPPTGIGTWVDDVLTHEVTLYDFSLGDIWKREWRFNNGSHHDPVPSSGVLYSHTAEGANTALYITGEGGKESNRELRISHCDGCAPHVELSDEIIRIFIQSGYTTQNTIKTLLENSPAVSEVYAPHGDSPWMISSKEYDSVFLTGGQDDEDLFISEATAGDTFYLATHRFKDKGTWEPSLTVYRENVTFLDGAIKITGWRTDTEGPTIRVKGAGEQVLSPAAKGTLGNIMTITAQPGARGNIRIILIDDPEASEIHSTFSGYTLYVTIQDGVTTIEDLITHLTAQELIAESALCDTTTATINDKWDMETMGKEATLEGGDNYAETAHDPALDLITVTIDSGITTSTDIAEVLSSARIKPEDPPENRLIKSTVEVIPGKIWNTGDHTNEATLPGVTTETATATVRIYDEDALNFIHTPDEAKLKASVTFKDVSDPNLEIARWEWHVFRKVSDGFETKATAQSDTGTAEVTVSDLGTFDIGLKATLKDGSTLTMVKEEALHIKGRHAGDSSMEGANGCFIGSAVND